MSPIREHAMEQGWRARLRGRPSTSNPHEVPAAASVRRLRLVYRLRVSWARGWAAADRLLLARAAKRRGGRPRRAIFAPPVHRVSGGVEVEAPPLDRAS